MRRLLYIPAKKILSGGYGRLYNWFCTQPQYTKVKYGYLYNFFACSGVGSASLTSSDDWVLLDDFRRCGLDNTLKDTKYWDAPNTGANNLSEFAFRGTGYRYNGAFYEIGKKSFLRSFAGELHYSLDFDKDYVYANNGIGEKGGTFQRFMRLVTPLNVGEYGIYTGNDNKTYKTKCVAFANDKSEVMMSNLAETKYRDGSLIPKVTDNTAWSALTTGAMCAYNNLESNAFETASIAPVGWHVPTLTEWQTMEGLLGGSGIAGGKLKEIGITHWEQPNVGATNEIGFNAVGGGCRVSHTNVVGGDNSRIATWKYLKAICIFLTSTDTGGTSPIAAYDRALFSSDIYINQGVVFYADGASLRLLKNDSTFTPGDTLTDIDGNIYPLVKIGNQVWTASNWKCTKYNDGTPIPNVTDNAQWAALTTGGQCIWGNDPLNL